jgi:sodium transport system permease protein
VNLAIWIFRKEIREMFRDKRVRSGALFTPFFMVLATFFLIGMIVGAVGKPQDRKIYVVNKEHPVAAAFEKAKLKIEPVKDRAEAEKLVREGKARLVLIFPIESSPTSGQVKIDAIFDPKEERGKIELAQMQAIIGKLSQEALKVFLKERSIPETAAEPLVIVEKPLQIGDKASAGDFLVQMLPYLIVIWAFFGGMGSVGDLVAGEKEKQTLETLLISPVQRSEVTCGKFLALFSICAASSLSALAAVVAVNVVKIPILEPVLQGSSLSLGMVSMILLALLPTAAFFAAIMLLVSTHAKNIREAQTQLSLVSLVVLIPAMMSQVIGFLDFAKTNVVFLVPVLNTSVVIRGALIGKPNWVGLAITAVLFLTLAAALLTICVRLFKSEKVLVRV